MKYRVKVNLQTSRGNYKEGDVVEFFGEEAEQLVKADYIERERKPFEKVESVSIQVTGEVQ
jgi:hypothetical protein